MDTHFPLVLGIWQPDRAYNRNVWLWAARARVLEHFKSLTYSFVLLSFGHFLARKSKANAKPKRMKARTKVLVEISVFEP